MSSGGSGGAVFETNLPGLTARGKVRDIYDLGEHLMIVASDRISAFDVVMRDPVPGKGVLLTRLSEFWLRTLPACRPNHLVYVVDQQRVPAEYESWRAELAGRAMVVRKAAVIPVECVVRGYLAGGGWKEYRETGRVSGVALPGGLAQAERLAEPIFTPSTKAASGHDEPISFERACAVVAEWAGAKPAHAEAVRAWGGAANWGAAGAGEMSEMCGELMRVVRGRSLEIYRQAALHAEQRGIILADTKFEFGLCGGELLLVDEVLTPDSSRFWPADEYRTGISPPSYDKQFLRDYLETLDWDKRPPAPPLPAQIVEQTRRRYEEGYARVTGDRGRD